MDIDIEKLKIILDQALQSAVGDLKYDTELGVLQASDGTGTKIFKYRFKIKGDKV